MAVERYAAYVDISAKIEDWDKLSVIAVSNGYSKALSVTPEVKQAALRIMGNSEPPQYVLMAVLTYIAVLPDIEHFTSITLDQDYSGEVAERTIRGLLLGLLRRQRPKLKASYVRMKNIAGSVADKLARATYKGRRLPDGEITLADIEAVLREQK